MTFAKNLPSTIGRSRSNTRKGSNKIRQAMIALNNAIMNDRSSSSSSSSPSSSPSPSSPSSSYMRTPRRHNSDVAIITQSTSSSASSPTSVAIPPPQLPLSTALLPTTTSSSSTSSKSNEEPPLLLLEGDEMFISRNGESHTLYCLESSSNTAAAAAAVTVSNDCDNHRCCGSNDSDDDIVLEEMYDIEKARKRISLLGRRGRGRPPTPKSSLLNMENDSKVCNNSINSSSNSTTSNNTTSNSSSSNHQKRCQRQHDVTNQQQQLTDIFSFDVQEINHGVQNGCGTGSMSWDSSIVMGLYFASNPNKLYGNVIELGSGVGLGGILLSNVMSTTSHLIHNNNDNSNTTTNAPFSVNTVKEKSNVTLTDANDDILHMLRRNITNNVASSSSSNAAAAVTNTNDIFIRKLDWFDFTGDDDDDTNPVNDNLDNDELQSSKDANVGYDTVIASDCAYLRSQIVPLSETISKLLLPSRTNKHDGEVGGGKSSYIDDYDDSNKNQQPRQQRQQLHMFAPYNRGVVHELIKELRHEKDMNVRVEELRMNKYRIKQDYDNGGGGGDGGQTSKEEERRKCWVDGHFGSSLDDNDVNNMTRVVSNFLHITAWHKAREGSIGMEEGDLDGSGLLVRDRKMVDID